MPASCFTEGGLMPELPEVETVRRGLEKLILGKKISSVEIHYPKMIKTDFDQFQKEVPGQIVESIGRVENIYFST